MLLVSGSKKLRHSNHLDLGSSFKIELMWGHNNRPGPLFLGHAVGGTYSISFSGAAVHGYQCQIYTNSEIKYKYHLIFQVGIIRHRFFWYGNINSFKLSIILKLQLIIDIVSDFITQHPVNATILLQFYHNDCIHNYFKFRFHDTLNYITIRKMRPSTTLKYTLVSQYNCTSLHRFHWHLTVDSKK